MTIRIAFILLLTTLMVTVGKAEEWSPVVFYDTTVVDCSEAYQCLFDNATLWIGGVAPLANQSVVLDFINVTKGEPRVYLTQMSTEVVSITIIGLVELVVGPATPSSTLQVVVEIDVTLQNGAGMSLSSANMSANTLAMGDNSILTLGSNSLLQTTGLQGTLTSSILVGSTNTTESTPSILAMTSIGATSQFMVGSLTISPYSTAVLGGLVNITTVQSNGNLNLVQWAAFSITGTSSSINSLSGSFTEPSTFAFYNAVSVNSFSLVSNSTTNVVVESGSLTITAPSLLNNTLIHVHPSSSLVLDANLSLGPFGGINIEGTLTNTATLAVGDIGLVIKSAMARVQAGPQIQGSVYLENGTFSVNQTTIDGSLFHDGGLLLMIGGSNLLSIKSAYQQSSQAHIYLKDIVQLDGAFAYITANSTTLAGEMLFSILSDITPALTTNLVETTKLTGKFGVVDILNGGIGNNDYNLLYTENAETNITMISVNFSKSDSQPKLALWKIFLIIFCSIGGVFIISLLIIKAVKAIKSTKKSGYEAIQ
eukprot:gene7354-8567_t